MFRNRRLLKNISAERIYAELKKLVTGPHGGEVIRKYVDIIGVFIPELLPMKGFEQHNPYHKYDILEHCIRAMEAAESAGFVIGAYIPVSEFSDRVQTAVNLVPGSQIAGAMRNILMDPAFEKINSALAGADGGLFMDNAKEMFAVNLNIFDYSAGMNFMLMYSAGVIAVFFALNILLYQFSSKRKD